MQGRSKKTKSKVTISGSYLQNNKEPKDKLTMDTYKYQKQYYDIKKEVEGLRVKNEEQ